MKLKENELFLEIPNELRITIEGLINSDRSLILQLNKLNIK